MCNIDGIVNIMKPPGLTSFQVVSNVKKILSSKKAGHTGTLDPAAAGVLPICLGKATKVIPFILEDEKEYIAEIVLGETTDTLDSEGQITSKNDDWYNINISEINSLLKSFIGKIEQIPPMYSALHYKGRRLYQLAREGKKVTRRPRTIEIKELELLDVSLPILKIRVLCSKGTYIRSLADDIGKKLSVGAHLSKLFRNKSGLFRAEDAVTLEELELYGKEKLLPVDFPLNFPVFRLKKEALYYAENGVDLYNHNFNKTPDDLDNYLEKDNRVSVYYNDKFISINIITNYSNGRFECKPIRVFNMHLP